MISVDMSDFSNMISVDEIAESIREDLDDTMIGMHADLTSSPPIGTPYKTGAARNSWEIDGFEIYSRSQYMRRLWHGWSSQSPDGWGDNIITKWIA